MIRRTRSISFTSTPGMLDAANDTTAAGAVVTGATLADTAGALPTGDAVFGDDAEGTDGAGSGVPESPLFFLSI